MQHEYLIAETWKPVYHIAAADGTPICRDDGNSYAWATDGELENRRLCKHCVRHRSAPDQTDCRILRLAREEWVVSPDVAEALGMSRSTIRHRLRALFQAGELNRREKPMGQRGYQYSQLQPEQPSAGYQGNDQLFESMLGGD